MPRNIKAAVSMIALLVAIAFAYYERTNGREDLALVALGTGILMVLAMWIFPEAEPRDKSCKNKKS